MNSTVQSNPLKPLLSLLRLPCPSLLSDHKHNRQCYQHAKDQRQRHPAVLQCRFSCPNKARRIHDIPWGHSGVCWDYRRFLGFAILGPSVRFLVASFRFIGSVCVCVCVRACVCVCVHRSSDRSPCMNTAARQVLGGIF